MLVDNVYRHIQTWLGIYFLRVMQYLHLRVWSPALMDIIPFWQTACIANKYGGDIVASFNL